MSARIKRMNRAIEKVAFKQSGLPKPGSDDFSFRQLVSMPTEAKQKALDTFVYTPIGGSPFHSGKKFRNLYLKGLQLSEHDERGPAPRELDIFNKGIKKAPTPYPEGSQITPGKEALVAVLKDYIQPLPERQDVRVEYPFTKPSDIKIPGSDIASLSPKINPDRIAALKNIQPQHIEENLMKALIRDSRVSPERAKELAAAGYKVGLKNRFRGYASRMRTLAKDNAKPLGIVAAAGMSAIAAYKLISMMKERRRRKELEEGLAAV